MTTYSSTYLPELTYISTVTGDENVEFGLEVEKGCNGSASSLVLWSPRNW